MKRCALSEHKEDCDVCTRTWATGEHYCYADINCKYYEVRDDQIHTDNTDKAEKEDWFG